MAFLRHEGGFACRYHMEYTSGIVEKGDICDRMAELQIDKIPDQKEILKKKLEGGDISEALGAELGD